MPGTLTSTHTDRSAREGAKPSPQLFVALRAAEPAHLPSRYALDGVDVVLLGRGEVHGAARSRAGPLSRLELRIADGWTSIEHARIVKAAGRWVLEDRGSTNGTFVNGSRTERADLGDGDVIEVGRTFLVFREVIAPERHRGDADAGALAVPHRHLETLSSELGAAFEALARLAESDAPILVRGESGTGKELTARAVHEISGRRGPFVALNCGAIPDDLVEGELFGHRRGAFSGAVEDRPGLVRAAEGGTLFLDEIGDLPAASQAVLLRVIQEREVKPIGATQPLSVDVRFVSATHRDLEALAVEGAFRKDLHARLAGFELELLPLRRRREDLGWIIAKLLRRNRGSDTPLPPLSVEAARALMVHGWPLNVRELEQCLVSAVVLSRGETIRLEHLPRGVREAPAAADAKSRQAAPAAASRPRSVPELGEQDRRIRDDLALALERHRGNVSAVARDMGKDRKQIHRWIERFGLPLTDYRGDDD